MAVGIIAEYNPFHLGHRYQIQEIRRRLGDVGIVVAMSGSFTQRGEIAILDKWTRARISILGGADLILELPVNFVLRSAQDFARGGVELFDKLGEVSTLAFGAELDDLATLDKISRQLDSEPVQNRIRHGMESGLSYAAAIDSAFKTVFDEQIFHQPNNLLAIEYLRAIRKTSIEPLLIPRINSAHDESILRNGISSAKSIRLEVTKKNPDWRKISSAVDQNLLEELKKSQAFPNLENLFKILLEKLWTIDRGKLQKIRGISEGLENRILQASRIATTYEELIERVRSKRYPRTRIARILLNIMLGIDRDSSNSIEYARVLAFNRRGREILHAMKKSSTIPIVTKTSTYKDLLATEILATNLRGLAFSKNLPPFQDFFNSPIYLEIQDQS